MSDPTWGLHMPGYSSPSPRAQAKFNKMYPTLLRTTGKLLKNSRSKTPLSELR